MLQKLVIERTDGQSDHQQQTKKPRIWIHSAVHQLEGTLLSLIYKNDTAGKKDG